jgi:hypothetical protein
VELLLRAGAQANSAGSIKVMDKIRLDGNARLNIYSGPLAAAIGEGHIDIVRLLLSDKVQFTDNPTGEVEILGSIDVSGGTEMNIDYAAIKVDKSLRVSGGIFNAYRGAISLAIGCRRADIVKLLLDNNVNPNDDLPGRMVVSGFIEISGGAEVNLDYATMEIGSRIQVNKGRLNAYRGVISLAIGRGHADIVQLLLANQVNPNDNLPGGMVVRHGIYVTNDAEVNLDYATMKIRGYIEVTRARCIAYKRPLVGVAWRGQNEIVQRLLKAGARDNFPDGGEPKTTAVNPIAPPAYSSSKVPLRQLELWAIRNLAS